MNFKNLSQSKILTRILYAIGTIIVALLIFQAGMFIGYHKAAFSYRWGQDYYRTFGGHLPELPFGRAGRRNFPMGMGMDGEDFPSSHGSIGKIIKIDLPTFIMEGTDKTERVVVISDNTIVRRFRETLKPSDLKTEDYVVIIGSPNNKSQIEARFIRLVPPPPDSLSTGTPIMR